MAASALSRGAAPVRPTSVSPRGGARLAHLRFPLVAAVAIALQERAVAIVQLEHRIRQRAANPDLRQRRSDRANQDPGVFVRATEDEPADHHVLAGLDKPAGADIRQLTITGL